MPNLPLPVFIAICATDREMQRHIFGCCGCEFDSLYALVQFNIGGYMGACNVYSAPHFPYAVYTTNIAVYVHKPSENFTSAALPRCLRLFHHHSCSFDFCALMTSAVDSLSITHFIFHNLVPGVGHC